MIAYLIDLIESELDASMDYMRTIAETSPAAFWKFMLFLPVARHRRTLPPDAEAVADLVSTRAEDCGTCVQIGIDRARERGVNRGTVEAVLQDRPEALPEELVLVYRFVRAIVSHEDETADRLRPRVQNRYGREGLVEIALTVGSAQVFPLVKRTLGYGRACRLVELEWDETATAPGRPLRSSEPA